LPELANALDPLVERLSGMAARTPMDAIVPVHGTFRPAQVLIHQGKIGFIDFDSFCQSEPSMDLALFLAAVRNIGMASIPQAAHNGPGRTHGALQRIDSLCETFLDEYTHQGPFSRQRLALWETLDIFTSVIHCWTKIKVDELDDALLLLDHSLQQNGIVRQV
jgi:aminoglycoside phosphotransferase (APT) family kinase protein